MLNRRQLLVRSAAAAASFALHPFLAGAEPSEQLAFSPLTIDSHVHVFARDARFPFAAGAHVPADDAPPELLLELMQANNIARTVIIQVIHYRWDNSYLLDVLRRYAKQFQGVCRVDPENPAAPDHLSQHTQDGFRGVRLSPAGTADGDWIRGPLMKPLWRRCSELKVPMTILAPVERMPDLVPLIEANPELTVVIDHMADCPLDRPDQLQTLLALARYPCVFVKITDLWVLSKLAYPYLDAQEQVRRLYDAFGPQRLMWATNWPVSLKQLPYAKVVELYRGHMSFFSAEDRKEIFSGTVQRVWPFGL
jgi:predicted TIM-barrel fold metal-dependent hydrolase